jgi:hypothetical protein
MLAYSEIWLSSSLEGAPGADMADQLSWSAFGEWFAAQAFLAWGLTFHVMPWIGLDLLAMAGAVAAFNVPLRPYQLFAGNL